MHNQFNNECKDFTNDFKNNKLHRPKRKMRQNTVMTCIFYNYVSGNFVNIPSYYESYICKDVEINNIVNDGLKPNTNQLLVK
jgi:hypothetical protein